VAPLTPHFLGPWCNALRNIRDDYEKEQAFRGLVAVVHKTPEPAVTSFSAFASEQRAALNLQLVLWHFL
jgi:transportin-1